MCFALLGMLILWGVQRSTNAFCPVPFPRPRFFLRFLPPRPRLLGSGVLRRRPGVSSLSHVLSVKCKVTDDGRGVIGKHGGGWLEVVVVTVVVVVVLALEARVKRGVCRGYHTRKEETVCVQFFSAFSL